MRDPTRFLILSFFVLVLALGAQAVRADITLIVQCRDTDSPTGLAHGSWMRASPALANSVACDVANQNSCPILFAGSGRFLCYANNASAAFVPHAAYTFTNSNTCPNELSVDQCNVLTGGKMSETVTHVGIALCMLFGLFMGYYVFGPRRRSIVEINP